MLGRVKHSRYGDGISLSDGVSGNGKTASLVVFDNTPGTERTIYDSFLQPSTAAIPEAAKKIKPKKIRKPKPEPVSDQLLVPELDEGKRVDFASGFASYDE
jgi:hypothetical protein